MAPAETTSKTPAPPKEKAPKRSGVRRMILLLATVGAALLLASGVALAASQLDQQQTNTESGVSFDKDFPQAQTFTAGLSGSLVKVSVPIRLAISSNPGDLLVSVQTLDSSGFPSGIILGSGSVPVGNFVVGGSAGWVDIILADPAPVSSGMKYALVLSAANAPQDGSHYNWSAGLNNPYPGGDALGRDQGGQWFARAVNGVPMDFAFKTFVGTDTTAPKVADWTPQGKKVSPRSKPAVTFSEKMDETSVEATDSNGLPTTVTLKKGTKTIGATVAYVEDAQAGTYKAILTPNGKLRSGATYTATVTTAAKDLAANPLEQDPNAAVGIAKSWKFTVKR